MRRARSRIVRRLRGVLWSLGLGIGAGYLLRQRLRRQSSAAATDRAATSYAATDTSAPARPASSDTPVPPSVDQSSAANARATDALADELLYGTDADPTDGIGVVEAGLNPATPASITDAVHARAADALADELLYGTDADPTDGIGVVETGLSAADAPADASATLDVFANDAARTAGADLPDAPDQHDPQSDIPEMTDLPPLDPATLAEIASAMSSDEALLAEGDTADEPPPAGRSLS